MKKVFVVVSLFVATVSFAGEKGLKCEATSYSERSDSLVVVCPPPFAFSPIRVQMTLERIDHQDWSAVDLERPAPVQVLQASPRLVRVRLPHQEGSHRWVAWRDFRKITDIIISQQK